MKANKPTNPGRAVQLLAVIVFGVLFQPALKADVVVLQNGRVFTGNILQQDSDGVLLQMASGNFRYPLADVREARKEAATAPHVSANGKVIPDWAQIVRLLASNDWATGIRQVPATVINYGKYNHVPYVSFRCASGGYEINIFGDLNNPAAVEIGAMTYLKDSDTAKSNCVNFICSTLANADDRKMVRALSWNQKDVEQNGGMSVETLMPGEWGSYGGWWVMVFDRAALTNAAASDAELFAITQPQAPTSPSTPAMAQPTMTAQPAAPAPNSANQPGVDASQPPAPAPQPATTTTATNGTYGYTTYEGYGYDWTADELAAARPAADAAAANLGADADRVYPRTYDRAGGTYGLHRR